MSNKLIAKKNTLTYFRDLYRQFRIVKREDTGQGRSPLIESRPIIRLLPQFPLAQVKHASSHPVDHPHTDTTSLPPQVDTLIGAQRKLLCFIFEHCKRERSYVTKELTVSSISEGIQSPLTSVKTTLKRLEQKGFIRRDNFKSGRGGWSAYFLPDSIYKQLLSIDVPYPIKPLMDKRLEVNPASKEKGAAVEINYQDIDIKPLEYIGFTKQHLAQIIKRTQPEHELLQTSIYAFSFDLRVNDKSKGLKKAPLDFFMGILSKGYYLPPKNYVSPSEELTQNNQLAQQDRLELKEEDLTMADNGTEKIRDCQNYLWYCSSV